MKPQIRLEITLRVSEKISDPWQSDNLYKEEEVSEEWRKLRNPEPLKFVPQTMLRIPNIMFVRLW